ncbi:carbohydrate ABC transporter permease [Pectobacterium quasiaquaticum]|uniref:Carbohydrate ABC transporter permease n=1 Tax=Pectobacterium quasiaquaticum TaxID=2774015 RepID=A0A9Q2IC62_9GAMM|nr:MULTISPECIES: carbohydrate ABC transporter permease [Pectobacterium]MBE5204181.1 carbohydrate ABC transporter permease [Pectobacterium quasiaquaticum]MBE5210362.1 carbohydrate ABC transporter permease [Pectobacterium quasiaquaticum]MBE5221928.1 carbohydrate ABC transporter permease [Pectobacterium quasiaquaticum]MBN3062562.1 carbohydrate ABC transporter permease [Pectobacterium aquaticum]URG48384.1 carbohydrate ABC transporter permease [Pectobacterium quasiaquaticum]
MKMKLWDRIGCGIIYAAVLIVFVGPFIGIVMTAFSGATVKPGELVLWPSYFTLENFRRAWFEVGVWKFLFNSLVVVAFGLILQVGVSALAAYALSRKKFRGASVVGLIILSTMMLPEEVIAIPLYVIINWKLPVLDASIANSYMGMILPIVGWAFSIFVLSEFMSAIPKDLEDAARVDGASEWQIFWNVILPLVRPALGTVVIFGFIMIWDQYLLPLIVVNQESMYTIQVMLRVLSSDENSSPNVFIAITLLAMLPSAIVYLGLQKYFNRGLMSGAVKG